MTEWQPIETAPKDGRDIILGSFIEFPNASHYESVMVGKWENGRFAVVVGMASGEFIISVRVQTPWTHWIPLPDAPAKEPTP